MKYPKLVWLNLGLFCTLLLTSACSSTNKQVIITLEMSQLSSNLYQQKTASLKISDLRRINHIVQVNQQDKAAILFSPQQPLTQVINQALANAYQRNGLALSGLATNQLEIVIEQADVQVQQSLLKYAAKSKIVLRVVAKRNGDTLTRTFTTNGYNNGQFKADLAVLERDFNQQLTKVLTQIVNSKAIQDFLI